MLSHFSPVGFCDPMDCSPPGSVHGILALSQSLCPWDSLGRNTGVGCHFLLQNKQIAWPYSFKKSDDFMASSMILISLDHEVFAPCFMSLDRF